MIIPKQFLKSMANDWIWVKILFDELVTKDEGSARPDAHGRPIREMRLF